MLPARGVTPPPPSQGNCWTDVWRLACDPSTQCPPSHLEPPNPSIAPPKSASTATAMRSARGPRQVGWRRRRLSAAATGPVKRRVRRRVDDGGCGGGDGGGSQRWQPRPESFWAPLMSKKRCQCIRPDRVWAPQKEDRAAVSTWVMSLPRLKVPPPPQTRRREPHSHRRRRSRGWRAAGSAELAEALF